MPAHSRVKIFDRVFPGALSLVFFISVIIWLRLDSVLPHYDMGHHLVNALLQRDLWTGFWSGRTSIAGLISSYMYYPPLAHQVSLISNQIFGYTPDVSVYANLIWILILSYALYDFSRKYFGRIPAVAALLFVYASPMMIGMAREFQLDLPLTAVLMLAVWVLDKSQYLSNRRWSLVLGLVSGAGMLIKWNFAIFFVPLAFFYLIYGLVAKKIQGSKFLANIFFAFIAMLLICGAWYGRNAAAIWADFQQNGLRQAIIEGDPHGFNLASFSYYFHILGVYYLSIPMLILLICGVIVSIWLGCTEFLGAFGAGKSQALATPLRSPIYEGQAVKIRKDQPLYGKRVVLLTVLLAFYYLLISALPNKDARYIMPVILILSLMSTAALAMIKNTTLKSVLLAALAVIFVLNNASVAFGRYWLPDYHQYLWTDKVSALWLPQSGYTSSSPQSAACSIGEIINLVPAGYSAKEVGQSRIDLSDWAVAYYLKISGRQWVKQEQPLKAADYLIWRSSNDPDPRFEDLRSSGGVTQIAESKCGDGSVVSVWQVVNQ